MRQLADVIPDAETLVQLEPEELGLRLFACIRQRYKPGEIFPPSSFADEFWMQGNEIYPRSYKRAIVLAMKEASEWLVREGLIMSDPEQPSSWHVLTRRGKMLSTTNEVVDFQIARSLPRAALHPSIADRVWMAFVRGEYDVAVFQAMKAVEVTVREASGLGNSAIGVALMREAFHPERGTLTDTTAEPAEREALSALFAGAVGSYKNPHSHRDIAMESPAEAVEVIMLANHLLRIVESRRAARGS
jgi:uncharacterized protein (TIGR02391 family)